MIINDDNLKESITIYTATNTLSEDGKPTYTSKTVQGIWKDINKVIQTGLQTSVTSTACVVIFETIADNVKFQRGTSGDIYAIIKKKVCRNISDGSFEGVVIYL